MLADSTNSLFGFSSLGHSTLHSSFYSGKDRAMAVQALNSHIQHQLQHHMAEVDLFTTCQILPTALLLKPWYQDSLTAHTG